MLYVTGYGREALLRRGLDNDGADVLSKPFSHDELLITIRVMLDAAKRMPTNA